MKKSQKRVEEENDEITFYDYHAIKTDYEKLKDMINSMEPDLDLFLRRRSHRASIRLRVNLIDVKNLTSYLRASILSQRQDNRTNEKLDEE